MITFDAMREFVHAQAMVRNLRSAGDTHPAERIPIEFVDLVLAEADQEDAVNAKSGLSKVR
jgi:hypothetical protein